VRRALAFRKQVANAPANAKGGHWQLKYVNQLVSRVRESQKGQTMTECVLIIAAIAVAGYIAYQGLEGGINTIIANVTATLSGA
jgi:Flp pilus assembly pilin Flp